MIKLQFVMGAGFSSRAIAWFSAGEFSHVDIVMPDQTLLGARSDKVGGKPAGVQVRPAGYEKWSRRTTITLPCSTTAAREFYDFAHKQVGKPYDSVAILGFAAGRNWREPDSWFCAELAAAALEAAHLVAPLLLATSKITPVSLALVLSGQHGREVVNEPV